jgi:transposase-like protein
VDQHGVVLDILVQERRNGAAAKRFFKRLLRGLCAAMESLTERYFRASDIGPAGI